jgi:uncharacterized protein (DUF1697 family)
MKTYIALFRGINVGGSHMLPMEELRLLLQQNGCADVRTYIQSGNAIFRSAECDVNRLAKQVTAAVSRSRGFEPRVLVLTRGDLERAAANNPFAEAEDSPKFVHLFFLADLPKKPDLPALEALKARRERFALKGRVLYLHTPEGFGRSRLATRAERLLGVDATARNWRTVTTLLELAKASG